MSGMKSRGLAALVGGAVAAAYLAQPAAAADPKGKEKCFGVAKAGENGCAAANGSHSCGGLSKVDFSGQEWKLVTSGECLKQGGKLEPFADAARAGDAKKAR
jgi:uncharacterized membrane protein